ncbi:hypothetical protein CHLNCDRAFT_132885 [Chlorella variabilis]|uniref:C2 NT-type domain-containing protein n=1 Tax=Chlorella variabilis TaxID=554065 RepID=E1Z3N8_CHLVA|nr:hypothetical protein CHLNCDRAFT_132885 [Chlorella variabilis]EFN59880.1 hypothetical protein CHLNCDRAFT_132885 [Chlorella variabilis]|eukprot:XP_005851982.1 hypothetical protein CHLNCDRAFT_132885 [Chlorella variabilis]
MFRKLKSGLTKGVKSKYRLDVAVSSVEGLPPGVAACRLQWARGAKVAVTKLAPASSGCVTWDEELSQIATLVKLPASFEAKEYEFKLQAPGGGQKPPATIGKASLDMARFAAAHGAQAVALAVPVPGGRATLHLVVGAAEVKGMALDDDAMSVLTGASGITESSPGMEQDLRGFGVDSSRHLGGAALATAAPAGAAAAAAASGGAPGAAPTSASQEAVVSRSSTGGERQAEVDALRKEVEGRDARLASLQKQLAEAHAELAQAHSSGGAAAVPVPVPLPAADSGRAAELERQNAGLSREVEQLRADLAAATSTAAVAAAAASASAGDDRLREQLAAAQARVGELEQQVAAGGERRGSGSGGEEAAAKLALAEQKIQQLMVLAQHGGGGGSGREAELEAALQSAEQDVEEAEAMAAEAMEMAEAAQAEAAALRDEKAAIAQELAELQEQSEQALRSTRWKEEREAKREADWDARLKEAYKRMEESVVLAERMQRERDELEDKYAVLLSEKQAVEAKLDPEAVDQQAHLLVHRLWVGELEKQLASVRLGEEDSYDQVQAAEDRADSLSLELQYSQGEAQRLAHELALLRDAQERHASDYQRELAEASSRADAAQHQLEEARAQARLPRLQLRQEAAVAVELRSRVLLLEEDVEASKLQLVAAAAAGGAAAGLGTSRLEADLAERQRVAEGRAAQLDALGRELADTRADLADALAQRERAEGQLAEARRSLAASASTVTGLEAVLAAREAQLAQAQEAQRSSLALVSARGRGSSAEEGEGGGGAGELRGLLEAERGAHAAELARLSTQLGEAQQLAQYSAGEMAGLVQQLAEAQGERSEVAAKLAESREEVARLRAGPDGELRSRIERLEKDLVIQRNRAEVNALFKEEHDRMTHLASAPRASPCASAAALPPPAAADSVQKGAKKLGSKLGLKRGSKDKEARRAALGGSDTSSPLPSPLE